MLLQEYYPQDVRVRKEVQAIIEAGHEVCIFCLKGNNQLEAEVSESLTINRTLLEKKRGNKLRYIFEYFTFFNRARKFLKNKIKSEKIDVVHIHTLPDFLIFAATFLKRRNVKLVLDMHEIMPEFYASKFGLSMNNPIISFLKFLERKSMNAADKVITVNDSIKELFVTRAKLKNPPVVIMNTCNEETHQKIIKKNTEKFIAVYHGSLTGTYNLGFAIRAICTIKSELPDFEFHIYGLGSEEEYLKKLISQLDVGDKVKMMGHVNSDKIPEVLSSVKLGILPMKKDVMLDLSFSNKLAEYVYYKIPVVCTKLSAVSYYFQDESLIYFESENEKDFCKKLVEAYSHYELALQKAERASISYNNISWDVMKVRLKDLYTELN